MKKLLLATFIFIIALTLTACRNNETEDKNIVYVTLYPLQFLVEEIAGDTVEVKYVPGGHSHGASIDWSAKEIIDMSEADLLFFVHGGADDYVHTNGNVFEGQNVELVDMSTFITYNQVCLSHEHDHEHEEEEEEDPVVCDENSLSDDPHFWLDPVLMKNAAEVVKSKLISEFPENQELYDNEYTKLNAALEALHTDFQTMANSAIKPIMTTVKLFSYWHERYDIDIISITNDVHSSEANAEHIIEMVEEAEMHYIEWVLFEKNANSPAGDQVVTELQINNPGADKKFLHGLGKLSPEEIENGSNYISLMYDNLEVLNASVK